MFDAILPAQTAQEMESIANQVAETLAQCGEVVYGGLVTNEAGGAAAGRAFRSNVDAVVVFPCMAAPPSFAWAALADLPRTPLVLWNAHLLSTIPESFATADNVRNSSNVGSLMLTNVLLREGRVFRILTGRWDDRDVTERVLRMVRAAAVAGRLHRSRLGVLGDVIPGYLDVVVDRQALKRDLGVEIVDISEQELTQVFRSVTAEQEEKALMEMRNTAQVCDLTGAVESKCARLTAAMEALVREYRLDGGAINCHTPYFRENPLIGIVACYTVSRLLQEGIPFTCTGDVLTALAALIVEFLGAPPQWCECVMIDYDRDFMLLSNTGEGNPRMAAQPGSVRIIANRQFERGGEAGACLAFPLRPGPATLLGFSPKKSALGGWSLLVAEGDILDEHFPKIGSPNSAFRFKGGSTADAFNRWCLGGATHHGIVTHGKYVDVFRDVADFLGIEAWVV
jgi:L-arabinose isomerase